MSLSVEAKLNLLGDAAQFDVSAPGTSFSAALRRAEDELRLKAGCIFYAQAAGGRCVPVFKVLMSNECRNDCHYCATRCSANVQRETFSPEELARTFLSLEERGLVRGLFLSSGVRDNPERTQEQMLKAVEILRRRHGYRGYIHLKVLPGVSDAAIEACARLATRLSVNLEAPTASYLRVIAPDKDLRRELLRPLRLAASFQAGGRPLPAFSRGPVHPSPCAELLPPSAWKESTGEGLPGGVTTQFVVGGSGEDDRALLRASDWLYRKFALRRVYYSGFRPIPDTPLEDLPPASPVRVHRLYQADFLLREYGFSLTELVFDAADRLPLGEDPKLAAARARADAFPVEVNTATREELLRVPGLGRVAVERILAARRQRSINGPSALRVLAPRAARAREFLTFNGRFYPTMSSGQHKLPLE